MKNELISIIKNQINVNGYSYIAHLAAISNENMVEQEIKKSPAVIYDAIYGYATVENIESMQQLIGQCSDKTKGLKMAIRGLVRGKHLDELYKIKNYREFKADIVFGHAQAGEQKMVAAMVQRDVSLFEAAIQGYGSTGRADELLDLVKGTCFYEEALYQAAKAGHAKLVNKLLAECGLSDKAITNGLVTKEEINLFGFLNTALTGYCHGYHFEHAGNLLAKGAGQQTALDELKIDGMPSILAYSALFIATPTDTSEALLKQIQTELALLKQSLSNERVEEMRKLQTEYLSTSDLSVLAFAAELPASARALNSLEQLDRHLGVSLAAPLPTP